MKKDRLVFAAIAATAITAGCAGKQAASTTYVADIHPMNTGVTGQGTTGNATLVVSADTLTIDISIHNAPAGITHWQHFHGFTTGAEASCPTDSADANGDGIVDLIETSAASGTTMVPFDSSPAAMDVANGAYPTASSTGDYTYHAVVPLDSLNAAFAKAFEGATLDLDKRVIYIHGVPASTKLPKSVASLGPIPADVTLPIACGALSLVTN